MEHIYEPPLHRIIAALNKVNPQFPTDINPSMVDITDVELHLGSGGLTNTRALLVAKTTNIPVQHFSGSVTIYYNRLNLQRVLNGCVVPGSAGDYNDSHEVLTKLKEKYLLPIEISDILPVLTTDPSGILISADYGSIGYYSNITLPYENS